METNTFLALGFSDLIVSGPDPFGSNSSPNSSSYGQTTFQLAPGTRWTTLRMTDDDPFLEDGDSGQRLAEPLTINGESYDVDQSVEIEYSYVVRPLGSTDPAEEITIYVLEFGSRVQGITASARLSPDVTYEIISGANHPVVPYSELVMCFTPGAGIATPSGRVAVERLMPGDLVCTLDDGPQPLAWVGAQMVAGTGAAAPVHVAAGVLGNTRPLVLSQQHRVAVPDGLGLDTGLIVPVKALVGLPGVSLAPCARVNYVHLMCERHQMVLADGAALETLLPGPQALATLPPSARREVCAQFSTITRETMTSARPLLRVGRARRALIRRGLLA